MVCIRVIIDSLGRFRALSRISNQKSAFQHVTDGLIRYVNAHERMLIFLDGFADWR